MNLENKAGNGRKRMIIGQFRPTSWKAEPYFALFIEIWPTRASDRPIDRSTAARPPDRPTDRPDDRPPHRPTGRPIDPSTQWPPPPLHQRGPERRQPHAPARVAQHRRQLLRTCGGHALLAAQRPERLRPPGPRNARTSRRRAYATSGTRPRPNGDGAHSRAGIGASSAPMFVKQLRPCHNEIRLDARCRQDQSSSGSAQRTASFCNDLGPWRAFLSDVPRRPMRRCVSPHAGHQECGNDPRCLPTGGIDFWLRPRRWPLPTAHVSWKLDPTRAGSDCRPILGRPVPAIWAGSCHGKAEFGR